jgi:hypothetical protein
MTIKIRTLSDVTTDDKAFLDEIDRQTGAADERTSVAEIDTHFSSAVDTYSKQSIQSLEKSMNAFGAMSYANNLKTVSEALLEAADTAYGDKNGVTTRAELLSLTQAAGASKQIASNVLAIRVAQIKALTGSVMKVSGALSVQEQHVRGTVGTQTYNYERGPVVRRHVQAAFDLLLQPNGSGGYDATWEGKKIKLRPSAFDPTRFEGTHVSLPNDPYKAGFGGFNEMTSRGDDTRLTVKVVNGKPTEVAIAREARHWLGNGPGYADYVAQSYSFYSSSVRDDSQPDFSNQELAQATPEAGYVIEPAKITTGFVGIAPRVSQTSIGGLATISADGAVASFEGNAIVVRDAQGQVVQTLRIPAVPMSQYTGPIVLRGDRLYVTAYTYENPGHPSTPVHEYDIKTGKLLRQLPASISVVAGAKALTLLQDGSVILDSLQGQQTIKFAAEERATSAAFDPSGKTLAIGFANGTIGFYDVATGQRSSTTLSAHEAGAKNRLALTSLSFDSTGRRLLTSGADGFARVFDLASSQQTLKLSAYVSPRPDVLGLRAANLMAETRVMFSPDDSMIAMSSSDGHLRLFDAASGALGSDTEVFQRKQPSSFLSDLTSGLDTISFMPDAPWLSFSADGSRLVCTSRNNGSKLVSLKDSQA